MSIFGFNYIDSILELGPKKFTGNLNGGGVSSPRKDWKLIRTLESLDDLANIESVYIYGTGETGRSIASAALERNATKNKIRGFIDSKLDQGEILGYPVENIKSFAARRPATTDSKIILASVFWDEIYDNLPSEFRNICVIPGNKLLFDLSPLSKLDRFHFNDLELEEIESKAKKIQDHFARHKDRQLFDLLIACRNPKNNDFTHVFTALRNNRNKGKQYMDFVDFKKCQLIFDVGVFDGSNSWDFIKATSGQRTKVIGFDPFRGPLTAGQFKERLIESQRFEFCEVALDSQSRNLSSTAGVEKHGSAAFVIEGNHSANAGISSMSLDDWWLKHAQEFIEMKPSLIKIDVEGFDLNVLRGAKSLLQNHRPSIAVSIYHRKTDLWDIPSFLLDTFEEDVEFYVENYTSTFIDSVLYAIPR